jgi:hypothetical protein
VSKTILAVLTVVVLAAQTVGAAETTHTFGYNPDEFEIKFYMQPRWRIDLSQDSDNYNSFRVRRGRVYLTSKVAPNVKGRIQIEAKPDDIKALDVYFDWTLPMGGKMPLTLTFGQFKKPFSHQELVMSSSDLNLIDRTRANEFLEKDLFAAARDQGAMVTADLWEVDAPVTLMAGVFHGSALGEKEDPNHGKQVVGRADVTPVAGLSLGANAALNRLGTSDDTQSYLVWGADAVVAKGGFQFVTEVFGGDNYAGVASPLPDPADTPGLLIWYAEAIYRAAGGWEPAARFEAFDPDTDTDEDGFIEVTGQIARSFSKNFRWQINAVHTKPSADGVDSETQLISQWTVRL